jgi:hypothetical protein
MYTGRVAPKVIIARRLATVAMGSCLKVHRTGHIRCHLTCTSRFSNE